MILSKVSLASFFQPAYPEAYMSPSFSYRAVLVGLCLVLVGAGCSTSRSSVGPTAGTGSSSVAGGTGGTSACEHLYYPLRTGYEISFKNTFSSPIDHSPQVSHYSWKVKEMTADSADIVVHFDAGNINSNQHLLCQNGGLLATAYVDLNSGSGRAGYHVTTRNATGAYLPSDLRVGSEWSQSFDINMSPASGTDPVLGAIDGNVTIRHKALREETVTVPAGTYTALKVETHTSLNLGSLAGVPTSGGGSASDIVTHEWWVKHVGLVKTDATIGTSLLASSEAERVTLP